MAKKGVIFDLDGTLIVNMQYHLLAWERLVKEMGGQLSGEELFRELYGKNEEVIVRLFGNNFSAEKLLELSHLKERYYREMYLPNVALIAGAKSFFELLITENIPIAIATASMKMNVDLIVDALEIREYFDAIITADDVTFSKPNPESFLKAAAAIGVSPENCLVFEDVPKGVQSAANAGMQAVVLTTSHTPQEFEPSRNIKFFIPDFQRLNTRSLFN